MKRLRYGKDDDAIVTFPDKEYWHHTPEFFERLCAEIGTIRFVRYHDFPYAIEGVKMAEFETLPPFRH